MALGEVCFMNAAPLIRGRQCNHLQVRTTCNWRRKCISCSTGAPMSSRENVPVPLLELRNIQYQLPMNFSVHLFNDLNFKVYPREFVVIIGANGAGKSTALRIMTGLTKVQKKKGDILWNGTITKPSKLLRNIGVVMQSPEDYFIAPTILDELTLGRESKTPEDVRRVLLAMGLKNISLLAPPESLSGGQVRRLAIASQLLRDPLPPLFLLDEPLAGVDWTARRDTIELLGSLKSQFAIVVISHEPGELLRFADRVVEIGGGIAREIKPEVIKKAIRVREGKLAEKRARAYREAAEYHAQRAAQAKEQSGENDMM